MLNYKERYLETHYMNTRLPEPVYIPAEKFQSEIEKSLKLNSKKQDLIENPDYYKARLFNTMYGYIQSWTGGFSNMEEKHPDLYGKLQELRRIG